MRIPLRIGGHESRDKPWRPLGFCALAGSSALERGWRVKAPSGERGGKAKIHRQMMDLRLTKGRLGLTDQKLIVNA